MIIRTATVNISDSFGGSAAPAGMGQDSSPVDCTFCHSRHNVVGTPLFTRNECFKQILGLVPLDCCEDECRDFKAEDQNYVLPVFGSLTTTIDYENDFNTFIIDAQYTTATIGIKIQKLVSNSWVDKATLTNNTYGTYYGLNATDQVMVSTWTGYKLQWREVLADFGEGYYRIYIAGSTHGTTNCSKSKTFCLKEFSCQAADRTVKFQSTITGGKVGDIDRDGQLFDLSYIKQAAVQTYGTYGTSGTGGVFTTSELSSTTITDSIRFEGFFGYEQSDIEKELIEYANGQINKVRGNLVQKFILKTGMLPKWLHDRLKAYAFMSADTLLVSDYNVNNSDYSLDQKAIVIDGNYSPVYSKNNFRNTKVEVNFKEANQRVLRSKCN